MSAFSASVLLEGRSVPSPSPVRLHAGPLTMRLEPASGFLRRIGQGDLLLLNGIYAAVRDRNWDTVEPAIRDLHIEQQPDSFKVGFTAVHQRDEIHFDWRGSITGTADGTIVYEFDGEARSDFLRNRIGFCVLHDANCAGQPCVIEHTDGTREESRFPRFISPHQPFKQMRSITHRPSPNPLPPIGPIGPIDSIKDPPAVIAPEWVEVRFEGETFEMEDQRNWTDASFKTYGTPLELPFPVAVRSGERIRQSVRFSLPMNRKGDIPVAHSLPSGFRSGGDRNVALPVHEEGVPSKQYGSHSRLQEGCETSRPATANASIATGGFDDSGFHPLPRLGLGMASHELPLNELELEQLKLLQLDHLRCDLAPLSPGWEVKWREAVRQAQSLGCRLHVALHLDKHADEQLEAAAGLTARELVDAWLVFARGEKVTESSWTRRARERLGANAGLIVGGTDAYFAELNRRRPEPGSADGIAWSINPQVHAFDNLSLIESLEAHRTTVTSAREFFPGNLLVSPVTLKPRFNPNATADPPPVPPDVLPPQVDVRQMSLFGAAWTLGSIASLSRAPGLHSITCFETTGWRGVMEWSERPRLPHRFVTRPNWVFPCWFVFALLAGYDEGRHLPTMDALRQSALLLRSRSRPDALRLVAASFDRDTNELPLPAGFRPERAWCLEAKNAVAAMRDPLVQLRDGWQQIESGSEPIILPPFGLVAVEGGRV